MTEPSSAVLARIEAGVLRISEQISDLSVRVARLETSEANRTTESERRFAAIETTIAKLSDAHDTTVRELAETRGAVKLAKWLLPLALGLGGVGTAAGVRTLLDEAPVAAPVIEVTP